MRVIDEEQIRLTENENRRKSLTVWHCFSKSQSNTKLCSAIQLAIKQCNKNWSQEKDVIYKELEQLGLQKIKKEYFDQLLLFDICWLEQTSFNLVRQIYLCDTNTVYLFDY